MARRGPQLPGPGRADLALALSRQRQRQIIASQQPSLARALPFFGIDPQSFQHPIAHAAALLHGNPVRLPNGQLAPIGMQPANAGMAFPAGEGNFLTDLRDLGLKLPESYQKLAPKDFEIRLAPAEGTYMNWQGQKRFIHPQLAHERSLGVERAPGENPRWQGERAFNLIHKDSGHIGGSVLLTRMGGASGFPRRHAYVSSIFVDPEMRGNLSALQALYAAVTHHGKIPAKQIQADFANEKLMSLYYKLADRQNRVRKSLGGA